ncbi:murein L,D-transpeptidase YcbB/YkuD [Flavobacterium cutihirudinis]|uniref:Murein L,D-transpeptidase YcbB/YkuD n=1 Tax=Flavobacterium cutihirudinis TaxID=1265740 RepID=A0A3D9FT16_9FLAO|nr:L,D-transpeptidase family protein [Flavobacterium cutihirudinis]RED23698.1 murein L,D-transpeptidase YcbB/YkuD [Flavobacterium cutihirudinis]
MKNFTRIVLILVSVFFISPPSYSTDLKKAIIYLDKKVPNNYGGPTIDNAALVAFFKKYSDLKPYQSDVTTLYKDKGFKSIWYDGDDVTEFAYLLYNKLNASYEQGVEIKIPYKKKIDLIFNEEGTEKLSQTDTEFFLSSMYILYAKNVFEGMSAEGQKKIEWYLPKKKISYETLLDSIFTNPELLDNNKNALFSQYYKLQDALKKYLAIQKSGGWKTIEMDTPFQDLRPDAKSKTIAQVRERLFLIGDLATDSKSDFYDQELMDGVMKYKLRHAQTPNYILAKEHIDQMNEPITDRIKTLMLNMERCRWIPPQLEKQDEYVMVNIPSFMLYYVRDQKFDLVSKVFIGSPLTKTTIFSGQIDRIVFSPYWTVPQSIVDNELKLKIAEDKNYLADHNMEMSKGRVRQKPGPDNSLGLVKFMFPNPNDIYMHDSPAKSLFGFEKRIFSHGCINVEKAKELAVEMLKSYPEWTTEKINDAMSGQKETPFMLPKKVPIYIGYFTAWVTRDGNIDFYPDVYQRDTRLNSILFPQDTAYKSDQE